MRVIDVSAHTLDFDWVEGACRLEDGQLARALRDVDAVQKQRVEMYVELQARPESQRGVDRAGVVLRLLGLGLSSHCIMPCLGPAYVGCRHRTDLGAADVAVEIRAYGHG